MQKDDRCHRDALNPELTQVINRVYERAIDALGLTSMQYERRAMLGRLLLTRVAGWGD